MRLVFAPCADEGFDAAPFRELPGVAAVTCRATAFPPVGPAAYVALADDDQLGLYDRWFPGLAVRARAKLRHLPLPPGGATYLPVTFDSWAVLADGPRGFGAALEAARGLKGVRTVVCPPPRPDDVPAALASTTARFRRWHDTVAVEQ
jgi:hypothetical protein